GSSRSRRAAASAPAKFGMRPSMGNGNRAAFAARSAAYALARASAFVSASTSSEEGYRLSMSNILRYGRAAGNPRRRGDGAALARFFSLSHFVAWEPRIWPSRAPEKPNALLETGSRRAFSLVGREGLEPPTSTM